MTEQLLPEYVDRLRVLLPLAHKAYGSRTLSSPAHRASQEYTSLLREYYSRGGSLLALAKELEVAYAGLRRRVVTAEVAPREPRGHSLASPEEITAAANRVNGARQRGTEAYHAQLLEEYRSGISLGKLAKELGLSGSNPLYYGVHRAQQRYAH